MKVSLYRSWLLASSAEALLVQGELDRARVRADEALEQAQKDHECGSRVRALRLQALVRAHGASDDEVEAMFERAMTAAQDLGLRLQFAHCLLGLGQHYLRVGRKSNATSIFHRARALYVSMGMSYWEARAREFAP